MRVQLFNDSRVLLTDTWYRVFDYEVAGDEGQIIANGKEEVDPSEVPEEQRRRVEERTEEA